MRYRNQVCWPQTEQEGFYSQATMSRKGPSVRKKYPQNYPHSLRAAVSAWLTSVYDMEAGGIESPFRPVRNLRF